MFTEKEIINSYLTMKEFVFHASIIGFGIGIIEMLYMWVKIVTTDIPNAILLTTLLDPAVSLVYGIFAGIITYPLYSYYAKSKGGLLLVIKTKEVINSEEVK